MTRQQAPARANLVLAVLFAGAFVMGCAEMLVVGMLDLIATDLEVSVSAAGALVTANALGLALGGPLLTFLTTRFDRRHVLIAATAVFVLANLLPAFGADYPLFVAARVLIGAVQGLFIAAGIVTATSVVPPERAGRAMAIVITGFAMASALGLPLGTLLGQAVGWRGSFVAVVLVGAVVLVAAVLVLPSLPDVPREPGGRPGPGGVRAAGAGDPRRGVPGLRRDPVRADLPRAVPRHVTGVIRRGRQPLPARLRRRDGGRLVCRWSLRRHERRPCPGRRQHRRDRLAGHDVALRRRTRWSPPSPSSAPVSSPWAWRPRSSTGWSPSPVPARPLPHRFPRPPSTPASRSARSPAASRSTPRASPRPS